MGSSTKNGLSRTNLDHTMGLSATREFCSQREITSNLAKQAGAELLRFLFKERRCLACALHFLQKRSPPLPESTWRCFNSRHAKEFVVVNLNRPQVPINAETGQV